MFTLEHMAITIVINLLIIITALLMKSAPPRLVLYLCVAGMLAIAVPWANIGSSVESHLPAEFSATTNLSSVAAITITMPLKGKSGSVTMAIIALCWVVGVLWLLVAIVRSEQTKRVWRAQATPDNSLSEYANSAFSDKINRAQIYRLPKSSQVFATGIIRPEIWIGDEINSPSQIKAALNHELAHIAANDQITLLLIVACERLLWWNPLIWILGKLARQQMEYACDSHCQTLIGANNYRQALAELLLTQQPNKTGLNLTLGKKSDTITRLEKIGMNHTLNKKHVLTLLLTGTIAAAASSSLSAEGNAKSTTLMECHELIPEGVQYDFRITSAIDTREGQEGRLSVTLIDEASPHSRAIPDGARDFLQCIQKVVGVGNDDGWPES